MLIRSTHTEMSEPREDIPAGDKTHAAARTERGMSAEKHINLSEP
jgi:hypothetical protein